jgi:hypothetical protein
MPRNSEQSEVSVMGKLLLPENRAVNSVAQEEGISEVAVYAWRKQSLAAFEPTPCFPDPLGAILKLCVRPWLVLFAAWVSSLA